MGMWVRGMHASIYEYIHVGVAACICVCLCARDGCMCMRICACVCAWGIAACIWLHVSEVMMHVCIWVCVIYGVAACIRFCVWGMAACIWVRAIFGMVAAACVWAFVCKGLLHAYGYVWCRDGCLHCICVHMWEGWLHAYTDMCDLRDGCMPMTYIVIWLYDHI